jgi:hypothetical protein
MNVLQWSLWLVGLTLQSLLLIALAHGAGKQFPALFAYVVCLLGTTTADILAFVVVGRTSASFVTYYWSAEMVRQSMLFALVVSLALHSVNSLAKEQSYGRLITLVSVAMWAGSILFYYDSNIDAWMTAVVRNLSFFTGVLNLFVWFSYARMRDRDTTRLMIAAGLGLQMTGEAIGQAIRLMNISRNTDLVGALFVVLSHMLCLFIWWRAFEIQNTFEARHST